MIHGDIYTTIGRVNNSIIAKIVIAVLVFLVGICIIAYISINGISVLNRRAELKKQEQQLIEARKSQNLPIGPKEIVNIYVDIKGIGETRKLTEAEILTKYPNLTKTDRKNIIEFIEKIQNESLSANDLREMQEIYAKIEWKNDKNIVHKFFGNTNLKKAGELILERELVAFIYNFRNNRGYNVFTSIYFNIPICSNIWNI